MSRAQKVAYWVSKKRKKPKQLSVEQLRAEMGEGGGLYRSPNGDLVALWGKSNYVALTPYYRGKRIGARVSAFVDGTVMTYQTPLRWEDAQEKLESLVPDHLLAQIVYVAEEHYALNQPSL
jgi:hypothetical protein